MSQKEIWELTALKAEMMKGKKFLIQFQQKNIMYHGTVVFEGFKNISCRVDHFYFRVKNRMLRVPYVFLFKMIEV